MRPLYACRACGFLSTLGSEFKRRNGVLFDKDCLERAEWDATTARWIAEAIAAETPHDAQSFPRPVLSLLVRSDPA